MQSMSSRRVAADLYGAVVAAARAPAFYRSLGRGFAVPDTIEGRYEMIVLHTALLLRRMRGLAGRQRKLSQAVVDTMAADLDRSMRELGVGDLSVARFMKRLGEGFYGRAAAYDAALGRGDMAELRAALLRNIYADMEPEAGVLAALAEHVVRQQAFLMDQPDDRLAAGKIDFLDPGTGGAPC